MTQRKIKIKKSCWFQDRSGEKFLKPKYNMIQSHRFCLKILRFHYCILSGSKVPNIDRTVWFAVSLVILESSHNMRAAAKSKV